MTYFIFAVLICATVYVFVIFMVLTLLVLLKTTLPDDDPFKPIKHINFDDFKTGDIVSVAYLNINTDVVRLFTNSKWNHVGLIYVDPKTNINYVLEGSGYRKKNNKYRNFFKIPLSTWIRYNRKCKICVRHVDRTPPGIMEEFQKFIDNSTLGGINIKIVNFFKMIPYKENFDYKQSYSCYESTFRVLQDVGVIKKKYEGSSYRPSDLLYTEEIYTGNYTYTEPYELSTGNTYSRSYIP